MRGEKSSELHGNSQICEKLIKEIIIRNFNGAETKNERICFQADSQSNSVSRNEDQLLLKLT